VGETGAREQHLTGLVEADRHHPGVVVEDLLDPVAVVDVDVDVGDPLGTVVEQPPDPDRDVVVDAEPARLVGHRVVQATRDVRRVEPFPRPHLANRLDRGADDVGGSLVHPLEGRIVRRTQTVVFVEPAGVLACRFHGFQVAGTVHGRDELVRRHRRGHRGEQLTDQAELRRQPHRQVDPQW